MDEQFVTTSYMRTRPIQWFGIRLTTLAGTLSSCLPALLVVGILRENPVLSFLLSFGIVVGTFRTMEHFRQGKFENENMEKFMIKFKSPLRKKDLNKEEVAKSVIKNEFDWYLPNGDDLIGFKFVDYSDFSFETFVTTVMPILPKFSSAKFMRIKRPEKNTPTHLKNKNISRSEYCVFIRVPMQIMGNSIQRNELKEKIVSLENNKIKRMSCYEIADITEGVFFPHQIGTGNSKPFFRSDLEIVHGLAKGVFPEKNIASISLAQLPEKFVGKSFAEVFNAVSEYYGAICATIEKIELSKISTAYKHHFNKKHNNMDDENIYLQTQNDQTPVKLHLGILIHGNEKEIADAIFNIDLACISLGEKHRPIFGQDLGFARKALSVYLPGSRPIVPFRMHTVTSLKELVHYLPKPEYSKQEINPDLIFRTRQNKLFPITHDSKFPTAYISDMGAGKSMLLSLNILAHLKKRDTDQVAGCYIEVGGSFRFLMSRGLADAYFVLRHLDDGAISPLQDHPLNAFRTFGKKGEEALIQWINQLCGIDEYSIEIQQKTEHLVAKAVSQCFEKKIITLLNFHKILYAIIHEEITDISNSDEHIWITFLRNLYRYCDPKRWGSIFCPKAPSNFDFENARFIYFSSFESKLEPEGVYRPFFSFAVLISNLFAEKYSSNSKNPSRIQFMIDEMHILRKVIPEDLYVDLNSVARKEGKIPMFATQNFSHVMLDETRWGSIKKYSMIQSIKRLWFYQFPGTETALCQMLGVDEENEMIQIIRDISLSNLRLKERGVFSWGYIDEFKNVHQLIIDANTDVLWACTTHPGGIAVREACLDTGLYDYFTTCGLLALNFKNPIPEKSGIAQKTIQQIVEHVMFCKPDHIKYESLST